MKKRMKIWISFLLIVLIFTMNKIAFASESEYYVCFSNENYQLKNKNKMTYDETSSYYKLEDISLNSQIGFYISDGKGERYYSSSNAEMHVEKNDTLSYTIYFSKDTIFSDDTYYNSNCHFTYALYDLGSYTLKVKDTDLTYTLQFNPYQKNYNSFEAHEISLNENNILEVYDSDTLLSSYTISSNGIYDIIYTPTKNVDGKDMAFDKDGNYGSGDDYTYNVYASILDSYYISFKNIDYQKGDPISYNNKNLYKLSKNYESPNLNQYKTESFFLNEIDFKLEYEIYLKSPGGYTLIDDDNDSDTTVSKLQSSYLGYYILTLNEVNGTYASSLTLENKDFGNYYLATKENNYLYTENGNTALSDQYKFSLIDSDDDLYNSDYEQYKLTIYITDDLVNTSVYITNGIDYYKNGTSYIEFKSSGTYDILFSSEHYYGRNQNYQYTKKVEENNLTYIKISSLKDYQDFVEKTNNDSNWSKNKYVYLTKDISFSNNTPIINTFYGTFDGNYHSLINISLSTDSSLENYGLIKVLGKTGSVIRLNVERINISAKKATNVGLIGYSYGSVSEVTITGTIEGLNYVGAICGYSSNYSLSDDDDVTNSKKSYGYAVIKNTLNYANVYGEKYVGGIAGFNGGKIYECENHGSINNVLYSSTKTIEGIGGIAGYQTGVIANSYNDQMVGYKDCGNYVGGIAGISTGLIYYVNNLAPVSGLNYVGGIVGVYGTLKDDNGNELYDSVTDLNIHYATYLKNEGEIYGSNRVGGIIGAITSTGITLKNALNTGDIESKNGSYTGGICGEFRSGSIESVFAMGTITSSGASQGKYLGGIAGYSNATIKYAYAQANLIGNDFIGGIIGYMTSQGSLISSISNPIIKAGSDDAVIGAVIGNVENLPFADNKSEKIKYNYYISSTLHGIDIYDFDSDSYDGAKKLNPEDLISKDTISSSLMLEFQGSDGFIGGLYDYSYPYLKQFEIYVKDDTYDYDYDMEDLFNQYHDSYLDVLKQYATMSIQINFFEYDKDHGDIDTLEDYQLIKTMRFFYTDKLSFTPEFIYATLENGSYVYKTDDGNYYVSWPQTSFEFKNQNIYATYKRIVTTLSNEDYLVEGSFIEGTTFKVTNYANTYKVTFYYNDEEIVVSNFILKIKNEEAKKYQTEDGTILSQYGDYLVVNVNSSNDTIVLNEIVKTFPLWATILISVLGSAMITSLIFLLILKKKKKVVKSE